MRIEVPEVDVGIDDLHGMLLRENRGAWRLPWPRRVHSHVFAAIRTTIIPASIANQSDVGIGRYPNWIAGPMNHQTAVVSLVNRLKFKHLALLVALDDARNVHQA